MKQILKKLPVPIVGLMLGLAAAGNLIQSYGEIYRGIFGIISALVLLLVIIKIAMLPKGVGEALENPVVASVFPTLSMGIMLLSTYIKPFANSIALVIWIIGAAFHIILMLWFTVKFVVKFNIMQVFPSWFIVFVGIAVVSVTSPAYKMANLGQAAFWFGFVTYLILLPIISYRVVKVKEMPEPTHPTLAIYAAPASLLLAGYINSFSEKSMTIVWFLMALSIIMYVVVIVMLFRLLKLKFYPSYSGFTFPLVISSMAIKLTNGFLTKSDQAIHWLKYLVKFQEIAAVVIVLYVLIRYIQFLTAKEGGEVKKSTINA